MSVVSQIGLGKHRPTNMCLLRSLVYGLFRISALVENWLQKLFATQPSDWFSSLALKATVGAVRIIQSLQHNPQTVAKGITSMK